MKVTKCINNNVAIALDSTGKEVVVFGKGIGFKKPPFDIKLEQVDRTFYDVSSIYISMINDLPLEILEVSSKIISKARLEIDSPINSNIVFTLADHINFAIQRYNKNLNVKLPIINDIEQLFPKEYKIGLYGLNLIKKELEVGLADSEAAYIALHIINEEEQNVCSKYKNSDAIIDDVVKIIEETYEIKINKKDVNYSRFVSHMHYLLKRGEENNLIYSSNKKLYDRVKDDCPMAYICAKKIEEYLIRSSIIRLSQEEKLYLMLHINRLCTREGCNQ